MVHQSKSHLTSPYTSLIRFPEVPRPLWNLQFLSEFVWRIDTAKRYGKHTHTHINRNDLQLKNVERQQVGFAMALVLSNQLLKFQKKHGEPLEGGKHNLPTCRHAAGPTQKGTKKWTPQLLTKNGEQPHLDLTGMGFHAGKNCLQVAHPTADSCWRSVIASKCITCGEGTIRLRIWLVLAPIF